MEPAHVSPPSDIACLLGSADRQQRTQGLLVLDNLREASSGIPAELAAELLPSFLLCLRDANDKVATTALALAPTFAALEEGELVLQSVLSKTADTKAFVREAAVAAAASILRADHELHDARVAIVTEKLESAKPGRSKVAILGLLEDLLPENDCTLSEVTLRFVAKQAFRCCEDANVDTRVAGAGVLVAIGKTGATWINQEVNKELPRLPSNYQKSLLERFFTPEDEQKTPTRRRTRPRKSNAILAARSPAAVLRMRGALDEPGLTKELRKVAAAISERNESSWDTRVAMLVRLRELIPNDDATPAMREVFSVNLRLMARDLALQLKDARSHVVKETCLTITALATHFPDISGDHLADLAFDNLMRNSAVTISVISDSSIACLKHLISSVRLTSRSVHVLMDAATDKADAKRRVAARAAGLLLQRKDPIESEKFLDLIEREIALGLVDADASVRATSRSNMGLFNRECPSRAARISSSLDASIRKLIAEEQASETRETESSTPAPLSMTGPPTPSLMTGALRAGPVAPTSHSKPLSNAGLKSSGAARVAKVEPTRTVKPEATGSAPRRQLISEPPIRAVAAPPAKTALRVTSQVGALHQEDPMLPRPKVAALSLLVSRLQASKNWASRVEALEVLSREFAIQRPRTRGVGQEFTLQSKRFRVVDQATLEKLLVAVADTLTASHHKVVAQGLSLISDIASSSLVTPDRLMAVLEKTPVVVLRVVLRTQDARESLSCASKRANRAISNAVGPERHVAILTRTILFCKNARLPDCRSPPALPCTIMALAHRLEALDPDDFEWEYNTLQQMVSAVLPCLGAKESSDIYKSGAAVLRALASATPRDVFPTLVKNMGDKDRGQIQKIVLIQETDEEEFYSTSSDTTDSENCKSSEGIVMTSTLDAPSESGISIAALDVNRSEIINGVSHEVSELPAKEELPGTATSPFQITSGSFTDTLSPAMMKSELQQTEKLLRNESPIPILRPEEEIVLRTVEPGPPQQIKSPIAIGGEPRQKEASSSPSEEEPSHDGESHVPLAEPDHHGTSCGPSKPELSHREGLPVEQGRPDASSDLFERELPHQDFSGPLGKEPAQHTTLYDPSEPGLPHPKELPLRGPEPAEPGASPEPPEPEVPHQEISDPLGPEPAQIQTSCEPSEPESPDHKESPTRLGPGSSEIEISSDPAGTRWSQPETSRPAYSGSSTKTFLSKLGSPSNESSAFLSDVELPSHKTSPSKPGSPSHEVPVTLAKEVQLYRDTSAIPSTPETPERETSPHRAHPSPPQRRISLGPTESESTLSETSPFLSELEGHQRESPIPSKSVPLQSELVNPKPPRHGVFLDLADPEAPLNEKVLASTKPDSPLNSVSFVSTRQDHSLVCTSPRSESRQRRTAPVQFKPKTTPNKTSPLPATPEPLRLDILPFSSMSESLEHGPFPGSSQPQQEMWKPSPGLSYSMISPGRAEITDENRPPPPLDSEDFLLRDLEVSLESGRVDPNSIRDFREAVRRGVIPEKELDRSVEILLLCGATDGFKAELRDLAFRVLLEVLRTNLTNPNDVSEILSLCCEVTASETNAPFLRRRAEKTVTEACSFLKIDIVLEVVLLRLETMDGLNLEVGLRAFVEGLCRRDLHDLDFVTELYLDRILLLLAPLTKNSRLEVRKQSVCLLARLANAFPLFGARMTSGLDFVACSLVERYQQRLLIST